MRCPSCGEDNPADAKKCGSCGERLNRRPRRQEQNDESDSPFGKRNDTRHAPALQAYRVAVYSLIPLAGLVLGPAAIVLAVRAWLLARRDPSAKRTAHAAFAFGLGLVTVAANAVGVYLMMRGLRSPEP